MFPREPRKGRAKDREKEPAPAEIVVRAEILPAEIPEQTGDLRSIMDTFDGIEAFIIEVLNAGLIDKHVQMVRFAQPVRDGRWSENDVVVLTRVAQTVSNLLTRINRSKRRGSIVSGPLTIDQAKERIQKLQEEIRTKEAAVDRARDAWKRGGVDRMNRDAEIA